MSMIPHRYRCGSCLQEMEPSISYSDIKSLVSAKNAKRFLEAEMFGTCKEQLEIIPLG